MSWGSGLGIYSGPRRVGVPKIAEILSLPAKKVIQEIMYIYNNTYSGQRRVGAHKILGLRAHFLGFVEIVKQI